MEMNKMKHSAECECQVCESRLYSKSYKTDTCINEVDSIEYISGNWYVNYSVYDLDSNKIIRNTQWPISTWNKYAKINIEKFGKVE